MRQVFDQIESAIPSMGGWATLEKANTLASLVLSTRPKVILEIGVFYGRSLFPMALASKYLGHGTVIGIDPYEAAASVENENEANAAWWGRLEFEEIHSTFLKNVNLLGLQNIVRLERKRSNNVEPPEAIDIFHCDGSHAEQAVEDIRRFASRVVPGGFVILDDLHWSSNGPGAAAVWLEAHGFRMLYSVVKQAAGPDLPCDDWGVFVKA